MGIKKIPTHEEFLAEKQALKTETKMMKANEKSLKECITYPERMLYGVKSVTYYKIQAVDLQRV